MRLQLKRHNFGQWESFRGLDDIAKNKDVPFAIDVRWATFGLDTANPRKQQISAKIQILNLQNYKLQRFARQGATHSL